MGMARGNPAFLADVEDLPLALQDPRVLVLSGEAQFLAHVALADQDQPDPGAWSRMSGRFLMPSWSSIIRPTRISPSGASGHTSALA